MFNVAIISSLSTILIILAFEIWIIYPEWLHRHTNPCMYRPPFKKYLIAWGICLVLLIIAIVSELY